MLASVPENVIDETCNALTSPNDALMKGLTELLKADRSHESVLQFSRKQVLQLEADLNQLQVIVDIDKLQDNIDRARDALTSICGAIELKEPEETGSAIADRDAPAVATESGDTSSMQADVSQEKPEKSQEEVIDPWLDMDEKVDEQFVIQRVAQARDTWNQSSTEAWDDWQDTTNTAGDSWSTGQDQWSKSQDKWSQDDDAWPKKTAWHEGTSNAWGATAQQGGEEDIQTKIMQLEQGYWTDDWSDYMYWSDYSQSYLSSEWDPSLGKKGWWKFLYHEGKEWQPEDLVKHLQSHGSAASSVQPKAGWDTWKGMNQPQDRDDYAAKWTNGDSAARKKQHEVDAWDVWGDAGETKSAGPQKHSKWNVSEPSRSQTPQHSSWSVPSASNGQNNGVDTAQSLLQKKISHLKHGKWTKDNADFMYWDEHAMDYVGCDWDASMNWWKYLYHNGTKYQPADLVAVLEQELAQHLGHASVDSWASGAASTSRAQPQYRSTYDHQNAGAQGGSWSSMPNNGGGFGSTSAHFARDSGKQTRSQQGHHQAASQDAIYSQDPWSVESQQKARAAGGWAPQLGAPSAKHAYVASPAAWPTTHGGAQRQN